MTATAKSSETSSNLVGDAAVQLQSELLPSAKRRGKKSLAFRGPTAMPRNRGTGFEEYYAEPPLTPAEHEEEANQLYSPSHSFEERIETCIQRYRARRRLNNERTQLFNRFLMLGGVDCSSRQFNSIVGVDETEGLTKNDLRAMTATDVVPRGASRYSKFYASDNSGLWTVDFLGVVSGFLSVSLPAMGVSDSSTIRIGCDVVDNFLRYLLIHDVCPEYNENISNARAVCSRAQTELLLCSEVLTAMPGQFNLACIKLFCSQRLTSEAMSAAGLDDGHDPIIGNSFIAQVYDGQNPLEKVPKALDAAVVFATTVMLQPTVAGSVATDMVTKNKMVNEEKHDNNESQQWLMENIHITSTRELDFEIVSLVPAYPELVQQYAAASTASSIALKPVGIVVAKHYCIEEGYANQPRLSTADLDAIGHEAFFLDSELISQLCPGMKLRLVMHELSCDLSFVSMIKEILPSFYTFLPQELMMDWKEPRENERDPPSVDNPDADDQAAQDILAKEMD